jgi:hypothetical protein
MSLYDRIVTYERSLTAGRAGGDQRRRHGARILGTADDQEETTLPTPTRRIPAAPGSGGVPYWRGVYGLDPECRTPDWQFAARCVSMTLAALVFGPDAGNPGAFRGPSSSPAGKLLAWLRKSEDEADARIRFLALRLAAEQALSWQPQIKADDVTRFADDLRGGVSFP